MRAQSLPEMPSEHKGSNGFNKVKLYHIVVGEIGSVSYIFILQQITPSVSCTNGTMIQNCDVFWQAGYGLSNLS